MEGREEGSWLLGQSMGISASLLEVTGSSRRGLKHEDALFWGRRHFPAAFCCTSLQHSCKNEAVPVRTTPATWQGESFVLSVM